MGALNSKTSKMSCCADPKAGALRVFPIPPRTYSRYHNVEKKGISRITSSFAHEPSKWKDGKDLPENKTWFEEYFNQQPNEKYGIKKTKPDSTASPS